MVKAEVRMAWTARPVKVAFRSLPPLAALFAVACVGPVIEPAERPEVSPSSVTHLLIGVPIDGYPNWEERLQLVAINRTRADPNNPPLGTASDTCSMVRAAAPPYVYEHDIGQATRFHCANSSIGGGGLSHPSYCDLRMDIESTGCDGSPSCACVAGTECWNCSTGGGCGTGPGGRVDRFGFNASGVGEIGAVGYGDSWGAVEAWVTENCNSPSEGHRLLVTSPNYNVAGPGFYGGSPGSCWPTYFFTDMGSVGGLTIPRMPSGVHRPENGGPGTNFAFYVNYYDPAGDPTAIDVVIDGSCYPMTVELGSGGNYTYLYTGTVSSGCHDYYFLAYDGGGGRSTYPEVGSYRVSAGGGCPGGDYTPTQAPADCETLPCGNGVCDGGEDCASCSFDCGNCPSVCGNGTCEADEDCASCASDCGMCSANCGNASCDSDENCNNCPADCGVCPALCGDSACDGGETCASCPGDCGWCGPCNDGELQACGLGACLGLQVCVEGSWEECSGPDAAGMEICGNVIDDDCNGPIDDGCPGGPIILPPRTPGCGCNAVGTVAEEESRGGRLAALLLMLFMLSFVHSRKRNGSD